MTTLSRKYSLRWYCYHNVHCCCIFLWFCVWFVALFHLLTLIYISYLVVLLVGYRTGRDSKSIMMGRNARKMRIKSYRSSRRPSISHGTNPFCGSYSCTALNVTARGNIVVSANTYSFVAVDENCFTRNLSKIFKLLPWTKLLRRWWSLPFLPYHHYQRMYGRWHHCHTMKKNNFRCNHQQLHRHVY